VTLLWGSFEVTIAAIDVAYYILILNAQLGLKGFVKKISVFLYGTLIVGFLLVYNYFNYNSIISIFWVAVLLFVYSAIFTRGKWIFKLFWIGFPIILLVCTEMLATSVWLIVQPNILALDLHFHGLHRLLAASVSKLLLIGLVFILLRAKLRLEQFGYIVLLPLSIAPVLSIIFTLYVYENLLVGKLDSPHFLLWVSLILLIINLVILWLITMINNKNAKILEHELQAQKQEQRLKNYEQLSATFEKISDYQDYVHEVMTDLWLTLRQDSYFTRRAEYVTEYMEIFTKIEKIRQTSSIMHCIDDEVLNMVLSSRGHLAKKKGIRIDTKVDVPAEYPYNSGVVGSILMIVLDNAIETVNAITDIDGEKMIDIIIEVEDGILKIVIENPADKTMEIRQLAECQDIALRVAKETVEFHSGELHTICEDYYITTTVNLPLDETDKAKDEL